MLWRQRVLPRLEAEWLGYSKAGPVASGPAFLLAGIMPVKVSQQYTLSRQE